MRKRKELQVVGTRQERRGRGEEAKLSRSLGSWSVASAPVWMCMCKHVCMYVYININPSVLHKHPSTHSIRHY